jgi:mannosyltransferase
VRALTSLPPPPRWLSLTLVVVIAGIALALRLYRLDALSFWNDEVASMLFARLPPGEIWGADSHPPLFYLLLHHWLPWAGDDEGRLRLLCVLLSLAALPAVWLTGRRIGGEWLAFAATAIVACSAYDLRYAQELRMYSLLNCVVAWALVGFTQLLADPQRAAQPIGRGGPGGWGAWALLGLGTLAALYTQHMAVLLPMATTLLAVALWWGRAERAQLARNWVVVHGLVLLAWAPYWPELLQQTAMTTWHWIPEATLNEIVYTQLQLAYGLPPFSGPWPVVALIGFGLLTVTGWLALPRSSPWRVTLPMLALLAPLVAIVISWTFRPVYLARTLIWTEVPVALLVGAGAVALFSTRGLRLKAAGALLVLMLVAGNAYSLWHYYHAFGKANWRGVSALAMSLSDPGEVVLVPYTDHTAFAYYAEHQAVASGREPLRVYGTWRRRPIEMLAMVGGMPAEPQFLLVEITWQRPRPGLAMALAGRFPCHEVTRAGERSGMVLWRYALRDDCAR